MAKKISEEFASIKSLLYKVLEEYPETRNNDTLLYLTCCKVLGARTIDEAIELPVSIISVHKMRQVIQNQENLFKPMGQVETLREERNVEAREFMASL